MFVCQGNVAMVRKLLRMGADPNTQDYAGMRCVMAAVIVLMLKHIKYKAGHLFTKLVTRETSRWPSCY